ncbi:MAG: hypothetical protein AMJ79_09720 [Phycisphaerae bacterium SM23_30]|nr:MAG: hypothetical protein AMJ79_09720 [Phycisphaerae bacterium SM23_30]
MKKTPKRPVLVALSCLIIGTMLLCGCESSTIRTYPGDARPLEQVAVLITGPDTCPVFKIDGKFRDLNRRPGAEFHLTPGAHNVQVYYQTKDADSTLNVELASLDYTFNAGHVYAVKKSLRPMEPQKLASLAWTPNIQDLGDVVGYARQNPKYFASSKDWKTLRKEHGLTPSFFDFLKKKKQTDLAADPSVQIK